DGRAGGGVDVDPAPRRVGLDRHRDVRADLGAAGRAALGDVVGVASLGEDGELALAQAAQRSDEVGRQAADEAGAHEDGLDVPVGVVVGEDRFAQVVVGAGGPEVASGG